jgi:hypothetical protein
MKQTFTEFKEGIVDMVKDWLEGKNDLLEIELEKISPIDNIFDLGDYLLENDLWEKNDYRKWIKYFANSEN